MTFALTLSPGAPTHDVEAVVREFRGGRLQCESGRMWRVAVPDDRAEEFRLRLKGLGVVADVWEVKQ
jgi:hypothetical protein